MCQIVRVFVLVVFTAVLANAQQRSSPPTVPGMAAPLPAQTSRYNQGALPGRYRDEQGQMMRFQLKGITPLYHGGGQEIGRVVKPVLLNVGASKEMRVQGSDQKKTYTWAWNTDVGSGWIERDQLVDPPPIGAVADRNPRPPAEAEQSLVINAAAGRAKLSGLRHVNSQGVLPPGGGNKGKHYAGRQPGPRDFVYLLFAVPNVQRGGVAKDSIPDGGQFRPALDERGQEITEVMNFYRNEDLSQPVKVAFLYGRAEEGATWGWLARANVGERWSTPQPCSACQPHCVQSLPRRCIVTTTNRPATTTIHPP